VTVIPFLPSSIGPFEFQATLDGVPYTGVVTWGLVGRRYYISIYNLNGERVFTLPLIGSTDGVAIESASWSNGVITMTTTTPHGYLMGMTVDLVISGMIPEAYNGEFQVLITARDEFQFSAPANPGEATQLGASNYDVDISGGYFSTSKMIFRESSQRFEIVP